MRGLLIATAIAMLASCETTDTGRQSSDFRKDVVEENVYRVVVELPESVEPFSATQLWLNKEFRSSEAVIQYSDKSAGLITGKGIVSMYTGGFVPVDIRCVITIEFRENRARFTFEDMTKLDAAGNPDWLYCRGFPQQMYAYFTEWADEWTSEYVAYLESDEEW